VILIPIPIGTRFESTATDTFVVCERCERCQAEYVFEVARTARGSSFSPALIADEGAARRAADEATRKLRAMRRTATAPVPCPMCGWYQRPMIPLAQAQHNRWMQGWGIGLLLSLLLLLPATLCALCANAHSSILVALGIANLVAFVGGIGLQIVRLITCGRFDPNAQDEKKRKELGRSIAMLREDHERLLQAPLSQRAEMRRRLWQQPEGKT
jgi:hypothetical protein